LTRRVETRPGTPSFRQSLVLSLATLLGLFLASGRHSAAQAADSLDERFLQGLRDRRLYEIAENYCLDRISAEDLSAARRATLAVELARTYAEHAVQTPRDQREPLWERAHQVATDFKRAFPDSPRRILVRLQDALTYLAQGELSRQEATLAGGHEALLEAARTRLREAVRHLEQTDRQLDELLRNSSRKREGGLTLTELESLERSVSYQLARAFRNQAQCYPRQSADWTNSLTLALERLEPLAELSVADETVWRSRIDRAICLRLLGRLREAHAALDKITAAKPPRQVKQRVAAESIRLLLAAGEVERAAALVSSGSSGEHGSADLDFARLEAALARWKAASEEPEVADAWQQRAMQQVEKIERSHGPYWMRRAETLLAHAVSGAGGGNVAAHLRAAESFWRGDQFEAALSEYDRAYTSAIERRDYDIAFEAGFTAAAIQRHRQNLENASKRYRTVALQLRDHPRAPEAHLAAAFTVSMQAQAAPDEQRPPLVARYQALLAEHRQTWPESPTAREASFWHGRLLEARGDWEGAVDAYKVACKGGDRASAAVQGVARCYERLLSQGSPSDANQTRLEMAREAASFFEGLILGPERKWPRQWNAALRQAALAAARLRLQHTAGGHVSAERVLLAARRDIANMDDPWLAEADVLLMVALAGQGRHEEAAALAKRIGGGSPSAMLAAQRALARLAEDATGESRQELVKLELQTAEKLLLRRDALSPDQQRTLKTLHAAALSRAGRLEQAIEKYQQLADEHPSDGDLQEAVARLMSESGEQPLIETAREKWREIEKKSRRGGPRWFRARYGQAEALVELGQRGEAAKLIRLTKVLHPELGGRELKARFEDLLAKARRP